MADNGELILECKKLPMEISGAAEAIVQFCTAISGPSWKISNDGKWCPQAENFVTVKPQWKQAKSLAITLRGEPSEFDVSANLPLVKDQNGYSAFRLKSAIQIADAFRYVSRAHVLFKRGRSRAHTTPVSVG